MREKVLYKTQDWSSSSGAIFQWYHLSVTNFLCDLKQIASFP